MKKLLLSLMMAACTTQADGSQQPDASIVPPVWADAAVPPPKATCSVDVVGPFSTGTTDSGPCWMQVTADVRCQPGVPQQPRRIQLWWYAAPGTTTYGGGYIHTTYLCDHITTAVFYNTLCSGSRIMGGARFEDPLSGGILKAGESPQCEADGVPLDVPTPKAPPVEFAFRDVAPEQPVGP